jgi:hypothetical protein
MKKKMVIFLSLLVMVTLACNLSSGPTPQAPGGTPQGNGNQPGNTPTPQPKGTPPANPVSINDGLSSLNSYQMTVNYKSTGPDPSESSTMVVETQRSQNQDARYTQINQSTVKKGGGDPNASETDMYQIGNDQCSSSGEDWTWTSMAPNQMEMLDITKNMLGFTPLIDTPTFVAQETVNGVPSNHFTFKISGLGVKSGAVVNANQGDYWLAVDGQYIVKYILVLETSMDPQTNVLHEEISIEMNQINQPVNIAFPQTCLDASKVTPTP